MTLCPEQLLELTSKTVLWEMCNKKQKTLTVDQVLICMYMNARIVTHKRKTEKKKKKEKKTIILASFYSGIKYFLNTCFHKSLFYKYMHTSCMMKI